MNSWDRLALGNIHDSRKDLTKARVTRIRRAYRDPYDGSIYEGKTLRVDKWVTLRISDFEALMKAAGL